MSSAKTERLVNLTMALLGSRRYMTKAEIFRRVAGYSGSQETKERMFERDKDDLRALGIEIDVASHDPLFEDEVGYRIKPEAFQIQEKFDAEELGLISLALSLLRDDQFEETSSSLVRRINSLAVTPELPDGFRLSGDAISEEGLADILTALGERRTISFSYRGMNESRKVNPLGLSAWKGSWYLVAEDLARDDVRAFKLSRIFSKIKFESKPLAYVIPSDFNIKEYLIMLKPREYSTTLKLRKAAGIHLRNTALDLESIDEDWDLVTISFRDQEEAIREILWLGPDAVVIEPLELKTSVTKSLARLVDLHG